MNNFAHIFHTVMKTEKKKSCGAVQNVSLGYSINLLTIFHHQVKTNASIICQ